jgi:hypothetical protein
MERIDPVPVLTPETDAALRSTNQALADLYDARRAEAEANRHLIKRGVLPPLSLATRTGARVNQQTSASQKWITNWPPELQTDVQFKCSLVTGDIIQDPRLLKRVAEGEIVRPRNSSRLAPVPKISPQTRAELSKENPELIQLCDARLKVTEAIKKQTKAKKDWNALTTLVYVRNEYKSMTLYGMAKNDPGRVMEKRLARANQELRDARAEVERLVKEVRPQLAAAVREADTPISHGVG